MDLKFWIWLLIIVGSLVARAIKKKPEAVVPVPDRKRRPNPNPQPQERETGPGPMTFEDLLKEIQGSKTTPQPPEYVPQPVQSYDDRQVNSKKPAPLEDTNYQYQDHDNIYSVYEEAKKNAFNRQSLEETMKLENTVVKFNQFKEYQKAARQSFAAQFASEIKTPSGFKKAFIMNEILQRKF